MDLMRKILIASLLVMFCIAGASLAIESHPLMPGAQPVAPAVEFTRFGFSIYRAQLWAPEGRYSKDAPFVLTLTYSRDIARERILEASLSEMQKLGVPLEQNPQWREQLSSVLYDVKQGDTLTGVYWPGKGSEFFYQNQKTGMLDVALSDSFFSIWLDTRTSEPAFRSALIGQTK